MKPTVLITGASRGIGRACAITFAQAGYRVIGTYHKREDCALALTEELRKAGADITCYGVDVSRESEVSELFAKEKQIDILINNAGISYEGLLQDMSFSDWNRIQSVCLSSVFLCSKAVLPQMIARKSGSILNISSIWGLSGACCEVAYSAAKAGVIGFTKALAKEVGPCSIRVNCIAPGVIDTDMNAGYTKEEMAQLKEETPLNKIGTPQEVASAALFLATHPFITGHTLNVSGGFII